MIEIPTNTGIVAKWTREGDIWVLRQPGLTAPLARMYENADPEIGGYIAEAPRAISVGAPNGEPRYGAYIYAKTLARCAERAEASLRMGLLQAATVDRESLEATK